MFISPAITDLISPALDGIVRALTDRPAEPAEARRARAEGVRKFVLSFGPENGEQLILGGQSALMNELIADHARDLLRAGLSPEDRRRGAAQLVAMGRMLSAHVDRMGKGRARTAEFALAEQRATRTVATVVKPLAAAPVAPARTWAVPRVRPESARAAEPEPPPPEPEPMAEASWLDPPFEQWCVETPARTEDAIAKAPAPADPNGASKRSGPDAVWQAGPPMRAHPSAAAARGPALPRQPDGYERARALEAADEDA